MYRTRFFVYIFFLIVLTSLSESEVRSDFGIEEGDDYSVVTLNEKIKEIYRTGKFASVEPVAEQHEDGVKITLVLEENPIIEDIVVFGNEEFSTEKILSALPLKEGDFLPPHAESLLWSAIAGLYAERKIYQTRVEFSTSEGTEENSVIVNLYINEGKRLLIKDLIFKGNESYSSTRLRLLTTNRGSWWFIKRYYNDDTFDDDLDAIRRFYLSRGFLDVKAERGKFIYNETEKWVCPVIRIEEGTRYRVADIEPLGSQIFRRDEILRHFESMLGKYYSAKRFQKCLLKLHEMYGDEGFILIEAKADFERNTEEGTVEILLNIDENQRMYVGDIKVEKRDEYDITGDLNWIEQWYLRVAPPVKEEVIRKEVILQAGDVYRRYKEQRSIDRLKSLGIFEDVAVRREPGEKKDVMNMIVSVKEGITQALIFSLGYGDATGAYFQGQFRERNLFGEAKDLRISGLVGTRNIAFHIGYLDRYFRGSRTSMSVDLYRDMLKLTGYDEEKTGSQVTFGIPGNEYIRHYLGLRAEYVDFEDVDDDIEEELDSYPVVTGRYRIVRDSIDDRNWPTRGDIRAAGIETGVADGFLLKFTASYQGYWRIYKNLIYALDASGGLMPYDADEVGISERFFMGGNADLRGFKYRGAGPMDEGEDDVATGGSLKLLARNEIRFPLYEQLRGLVFLDVGTIDDEFPGLGEPRVSAGIGFRFNVKVFYIAIDFAHAFIKEDDDQTRFIHFHLGSLF